MTLCVAYMHGLYVPCVHTLCVAYIHGLCVAWDPNITLGCPALVSTLVRPLWRIPMRPSTPPITPPRVLMRGTPHV